MLQQQTLRDSVTHSGIGLHSGNRVNMTFLPAPANAGIRFRRVDLEGKPEIEARLDHVIDTNRSTTLGKGSVKIHTVEHILATFAGCGVDNAIVELDANEPPIGDGSARDYCRMVESVGLLPQGEAREPISLPQPLEFQAGETMFSIFPHDRLKVSCTSMDKHGRYTQFYSLEVTPESWLKDLSQARTFCFFEEIEFLIKNGLIRGGSLENAVVIRDDAILTTEPLRYPEEFVRHKILDILGDFSLMGRPLHGHVIAVRPSHAANCAFAKEILAKVRKPLETAQTFAPPPPAAKAGKGSSGSSEVGSPVQDGCVMDIDQVMRILPHRYPFLLVDRVRSIQGNRIVALKNITINEPCFQGHFPGHPIFPGVLQLEAIAQVAGILMLKQAENVGKLAYFMSAESVKWRKPVRPGATLIIEVDLLKCRGKIGKARGICTVEGDTVSEAEVTFMLIDRE